MLGHSTMWPVGSRDLDRLGLLDSSYGNVGFGTPNHKLYAVTVPA